MTVNFAFYIHDPSAIPGIAQCIQRLARYNIKSAVLGSPACHGVQNVQIIHDINQSVHSLQQSGLQVFISDKLIDVFVPALAIVQYWPSSNELYFTKRYNVEKDLDTFVVDVIKNRSYMPTTYIYNEKPYLFMYDTDNINPVVVKQDNTVKTSIVPSPSTNITWNFSDTPSLISKWKHLTQTLTLDQHETKFQVVINAPAAHITSKNIIYFCMEPKGENTYKDFLDQLKMANVQPLCLGTHKHHLNNAEWHLKATLGQLRREEVNCKKTYDKVLSVVVSDKDWDPGHKFRLALIKYLDAMSDKQRGYDLHIYGRCQKLGFKHYKGELPDQEKDDALLHYKYHINVENHYIDNYITEKLYDCLAAETLCFYKGAPNVETFFSGDSFVSLSGEIEKDAAKIKEIIANGGYVKRINAIKKAKEDLLWKYAFEPRVLSIMSLEDMHVIVPNAECKVDYEEQSFRNIEVQAQSNTMVVAQRSVQQNQVIYLQQSSEVRSLLFDKICFAIAEGRRAGNVDLVIVSKNGDEIEDVLMFPSGAEKFLINKMSNRPLLQSISYVSV
jgi:hypothetical protein